MWVREGSYGELLRSRMGIVGTNGLVGLCGEKGGRSEKVSQGSGREDAISSTSGSELVGYGRAIGA